MPVMKKPILALDTKIVQDNIPFEVLPKLFIGSIHSSFNLDALNEHGITHILNCSRLPASFPKIFTYLSVDIRDKDDSNILACIPTSNIFIEAGMDCGGVLVHCVGGRSRSAALIAGYLMSSGDMTYDDALSLILSVRPVVSVNRGFEIQLRAYSKNCYDVYSAQQVIVRSRIKALHNIRGSKSAIESISSNFENVRKNMTVISPANKKGNTPASNHSNNSSSRKLNESELRAIYNNSSSNLPQSTIIKPINRKSFEEINQNESTPSAISQRKMFDVSSSNKRSWVENSTTIIDQIQENDNNNDAMDESKRHPVPIRHAVSEVISRESIRDNTMDNDNRFSNRALSSLSSSKLKYSEDHNKSMQSLSLSSTNKSSFIDSNSQSDSILPTSTKVSSRTAADLSPLNSNIINNRNSLRLSNNPSPQETTDANVDLVFPKLVSKTSQSSMYQHHDDVITNAILLHNNSISSRRNSFSQEQNGSGHSSPCEIIPQIKERPRSSNTMLPIPIIPGKISSRPPSMSLHSQDTNDIEGQFESPLSRNGSFHVLSRLNSKTNTPNEISRMHGNSKPPLGKSPIHTTNNDFDMNIETSQTNSKDIDSKQVDENDNAETKENYILINKKKDKKENIGYQSIIREFIPLFDSRSPNIRLSRPGTSTVRIIPPLRGLDRNYSCSWCGVGLFNLANVIRLDLNINNDGYDILPKTSSNDENISKGKVHIPTSTTNRSSGLFQLQKQYSVELSPHSMSEFLSISAPKANSKAITPHQTATATNPSTNLSSKFNSATVDLESEDTFNENYHSHGINRSFVPKPPQSTRPKNYRAFDFDSSSNNEPMIQTPVNISIPPMLSPNRKSITSSLTIRTTDSPIPNDNMINISPSIMSIHRKFSSYSSDESPRVNIPPHRLSGSWTPSERPTSVEKRRWLSRVHLLNESMTDESRLLKLANDDDEAQRKAFLHNKYIYLEYLEWMGSECFESNNNIGEIKCCNCSKVIGSYTWTPSERQSVEGKLEPPLFRIHKHVVQQSDFPLDATPIQTPRLDDLDSDII